jgi:hypothetical protein
MLIVLLKDLVKLCKLILKFLYIFLSSPSKKSFVQLPPPNNVPGSVPVVQWRSSIVANEGHGPPNSAKNSEGLELCLVVKEKQSFSLGWPAHLFLTSPSSVSVFEYLRI